MTDIKIKDQKTHIIAKSIQSSLRSESKIILDEEVNHKLGTYIIQTQ